MTYQMIAGRTKLPLKYSQPKAALQRLELLGACSSVPDPAVGSQELCSKIPGSLQQLGIPAAEGSLPRPSLPGVAEGRGMGGCWCVCVGQLGLWAVLGGLGEQKARKVPGRRRWPCLDATGGGVAVGPRQVPGPRSCTPGTRAGSPLELLGVWQLLHQGLSNDYRKVLESPHQRLNLVMV